ncbi:MAG TPA: hypothetical protein PK819_08930 [Thermomicrobiales bacterium]|nr:hypothetical protein [Thermomicrobiales bacterium]
MRTRLAQLFLLVLTFVPADPVSAQQVTDGTFIDPVSGFVVTWDAKAFRAEMLTEAGGILISNDNGSLIVAVGHGASAAECLEYQITGASTDPNQQSFTETTLADAPIVESMESSGSVTLTDANGETKNIWFGCVPAFGPRGEARGFVLIIVAAPVATWEVAVRELQPVIDGIQVPAVDPARSNALDGNTFTNQADGWTVSWDGERYSVTLTGDAFPDGVHLVREGTIEYGDVRSFAGDVTVCLESFAEYFATYDGVVSFEPADLRGPKIAMTGSATGIWHFTYQPSAAGSEPRTFVEWATCLPLSDSPDRSLRVSFSTSEELFKSTRKGWQAILRSVELVPVATPVA